MAVRHYLRKSPFTEPLIHESLPPNTDTVQGNIPSFALFVGLVLMLVVPFLVLLIVTLTIRRREARRVQHLMRDAEQGTDNPIGAWSRDGHSAMYLTLS